LKIEPFTGAVKVRVEAQVNPSEDPEKVKLAMNCITPAVKIYNEGGGLVGESDSISSLYNIYEKIRIRQTMAAVRRLLLSHIKDDSTWLYFNKQAAFVGVVSVCEEWSESHLGPIKLTISSRDIHALIDWLSPR